MSGLVEATCSVAPPGPGQGRVGRVRGGRKERGGGRRVSRGREGGQGEPGKRPGKAAQERRKESNDRELPWIAGRSRSFGAPGGVGRPWSRGRGPGHPGPGRERVVRGGPASRRRR